MSRAFARSVARKSRRASNANRSADTLNRKKVIMSDHIFKVAGHMESELVFYPSTSCGHIRNGVGFANGRKNGGWVIAYDDLLQMVKLAKQARRRTKRALDASWSCENCGFENHSSWSECGECQTPRK